MADHLQPFVLPAVRPEHERLEHHDLYFPSMEGPSPAVVFVPGLYPSDWRPTARDWPTYVGYGATATTYGVAGVVADLPLHAPAAYPTVAAMLAAVIDEVRADPRIDGDRLALWAFSGGGLLTASWLGQPPSWLRCVALSYPVLAPLPGWEVDPAFRPTERLGPSSPPLVLTRAGRDHPDVAATVPAFVDRVSQLGLPLDLVEVPDGQHGFDSLDHTDDSRAAVRTAFELVTKHLRTRA